MSQIYSRMQHSDAVKVDDSWEEVEDFVQWLKPVANNREAHHVFCKKIIVASVGINMNGVSLKTAISSSEHPK